MSYSRSSRNCVRLESADKKMARTKQVRTFGGRSRSLVHPIGRFAKPVDNRKRKKSATNVDAPSPDTATETPVKLEAAPQTAVSTISNAGAVAILPNERPSSGPKITNGTTLVPVQTNGTAENDAPTSRNTSALFHSLCYSEEVLSALPNRTWAIHCTETPEKRIVVSAMTMYKSQDSCLTPFYIKQIIFDERLNFDLLLVNSRIVLKDKPMSISTMVEFEDLLDYVDCLKVCAGGPSISQYSRVNPECAYRDSMNNWRHNLCSLEINTGDVCESCNSLEEILRRHAQRNRTMVKTPGKRKR